MPFNNKKTDEQLMLDYRDGKLQAFDVLFSRFKDMLFRYLVRQTGSKSVAEELFQETWTSIIKNRKSYVAKAKFKTYLFHIAHHKLIDYYRSRQNNRDDFTSYDEQHAEIADTDPLSDDMVTITDIAKKYEYLLALLEKLPAAQRDVFLMHEEAGMTLPEIADVMDISRDTVKSRLKYAVHKLRHGMRRFQ